MQFDPKFSFWLGVVVTAMIGIAGGTVHLTHAIPDAWIPAVTAWASLLAFFGSGLLTAMHGLSSSQPGPLVPPKVVVALAIGLAALALGWASPADAQTPRPTPPRLTGDPVRDIGSAINGQRQQQAATQNQGIEDLVGRLNKLALPDFEYALAMAKATNNVVSAPCWEAWVTMLTAQQKPLLDSAGQALTEPDPHLITNIERVSELLAALRPDSPLSTNCAALAGAANRDVAALIGGILSGGALGLFKLPVIP